jgi:putative membrane protein
MARSLVEITLNKIMKNTHSLFTHSRLSLAAALLIGAFAAGTTLADDATIKKADKSFIKSAYQDGLAEIKMGELGQSKSASADVKAFAAQMVTDHSAANTELKTLADSKKVEVATEPGLVAQGKAKLLDAKTGADFDKAFAADMVADHKKAVAAFEKETSNSDDQDVKAFAVKTLPTLKSHLSMAQDLQNKVGK